MIIDSILLTPADISTQILPAMRSAVIETHSATKKLSDQLKRAAAAAKSVKNGKTTEMKNKREVTQMETEDCNDLQVFLDKGGMDDTFLQYVGEGFWVNEAGRSRF